MERADMRYSTLFGDEYQSIMISAPASPLHHSFVLDEPSYVVDEELLERASVDIAGYHVDD